MTGCAHTIKSNNWELRLPTESVGDLTLQVYLDIYGNEYTEVVSKGDFAPEVDDAGGAVIETTNT